MLGSRPQSSPNINSLFQGASDAMGKTLTSVGQYGQDAFIGGQGRPVPFPFNQGLIAKVGNVQKYPVGSKAREDAEFDLYLTPVMGLSQGVQSAPHNFVNSKLSLEQIYESQLGFKPGIRKAFDTALQNKDANTVKKLINEVPLEYQKRFAPDIVGVLKQGKSMQSVSPDFDTAVDLIKSDVRAPQVDINAAYNTVMKEAKEQLTPDEINSLGGNMNAIINLIQKRLRVLE